FEILLHRIGDLIQDTCPLCRCCFSPCLLCRMCSIKGDLNVLCCRTRYLREILSRHWTQVRCVFVSYRCHPTASDKVFVTRFHCHNTVRTTWPGITSRSCCCRHGYSSLKYKCCVCDHPQPDDHTQLLCGGSTL